MPGPWRIMTDSLLTFAVVVGAAVAFVAVAAVAFVPLATRLFAAFA